MSIRQSTENRSVPFCAPFFVALLLVLAAPLVAASAANRVDEVDLLLNAGAVSLALGVIEQEQPAYAASPVGWQRWERRRLEILEAQQDWPALIARVDDYPSPLPDDFSIAARESMVRAHLAAGDGAAAAAVIAGLIWGTAQDTAMYQEGVARLQRWRAMLVNAYLQAGQMADAQTTVLRYRLDYGADPDGWRLAHAKALLRAGEHHQARELLVGLESTEVAYLKLLLRSHDISVDPVELLAEMAPFLGEGRLLAAERSQLWASLARAAARYRDHEVRVTAMEQALALRAPVVAQDRFVTVNGDDLWAAYVAYAEALANEAQLLVGRFDDWLALAERLSRSDALKARALYAYLAIQKRDPRVAERAQQGLAAALARETHGLPIIAGLYLDSRRYPEVSDLPAPLRLPLIAYAVEVSRRDLAAQLLMELDSAARREPATPWRAPLAVALIGAGKIDEAVALYGEQYIAEAEPGTQSLAAAIRVAAALQVAGDYSRAARLLTRSLVLANDEWSRRELSWLAAEAEDRAGRHDRAARLYLESAVVPGGGSADVWSWSARLQAARALARAGLAGDAAGVVESALADIPGAAGRAYLERAARGF